MSVPVDVLAVMDRCVARLDDDSAGSSAHICALEEARAAVAELIEAGPAMLRFLDLHQYLDRNGDVRRFRATLARIGGAA